MTGSDALLKVGLVDFANVWMSALQLNPDAETLFLFTEKISCAYHYWLPSS